MAELKISRETALYLVAIIFAIIGGVGLLIGVDIMAGLGGLVAIVSALFAQSPIGRSKSSKSPKLPPAAGLVLALGATLALGACGPSLIAPGTPPAVEAACIATLQAPRPWLEVARPYVPEADAIRATEALLDIEAAAPLVCGLIRAGLETAVRNAAPAAP